MEPVSPDIEVIGVIPDRKYRDLRETPPAQAYFPYLEGVHFRFMNIYLRTQADPRQIENELRERMRQFDPHVPVVGLQTMNEQIGFSLRTERLVASLSGLFGGLATLLAVIGLCGVMAYVVMRRTREIGIRIALGALRSNVIAMVMREAFILIGAGLAAGFSLALALANRSCFGCRIGRLYSRVTRKSRRSYEGAPARINGYATGSERRLLFVLERCRSNW
jgi:hypothetical protein